MTIEQEALEIAVEASGRRMRNYDVMTEENVLRRSIEAHARALEQLRAEREAHDAERAGLEAEIERLREALHEGKRAIGDHSAPDDCYATGPLTGDDYRDLVECPACSFIAVYEALKDTRHDT